MTLADRAVWFIQNLTLTDDYEGERVRLRPWQEKIVRDLHQIRPDGLTQIRKSLLLLPRKQGKSQLASQLAIFHVLGTNKCGQSCILAATNRNIASLTFAKIKRSIEVDPYLAKQCRIYTASKRIEIPASANSIQVIPSDGKAQHGHNPSLVIFDEVWNQKKRDLYDALSSSFRARREFLFLCISTQGNSRDSLIYELYEYACKVRDGEIVDPEFYPCIFEALPDDDWCSEATWFKAQPALGDFASLADMRADFQMAKVIPAEESKFRQFYLNQLVSGQSKFFSELKWAACVDKEPIPLEAFKGKPCFAGVDLSTVKDLSALAMLFLTDDGCYHVYPTFWLPRATAEAMAAKGDRRYLDWARSQSRYVNLTEGETIDYQAIEDHIIRLSNEYDIQRLCSDPWNATHLAGNLRRNGVRGVSFLDQNYRGLNGPTKLMLKLVVDGKLRHPNHPVLNWMAGNATLRVDGRDNYLICKPHNDQKIDGIAALVNAIGAAMGGRLDMRDNAVNLGDSGTR